MSKQMRFLVAEKELFIGRIWGIEDKSNCLILRFKVSHVPRINSLFFLGLVGPDSVGDPSSWEFTYRQFRESEKKDYWNKQGVEIQTVNYLSIDEKWAYILVNVAEHQFMDDMEQTYLYKGTHPLIVVAQSDPPFKYLLNLKEFIEHHPNNKILNYQIINELECWNPHVLDNANDVSTEMIEMIQQQKYTLIQGPPGTGKSYLAAQICDHFLANNKSVSVTALTNKALIEIAQQPALVDFLRGMKIYKTNITNEETRKLPWLLDYEDSLPSAGELLLTTYYKLSELYKKVSIENKRFDLLIIEEASQAFLPTIAMFSTIAHRILIVGDHKQLSPVVQTSDYKLKLINQDIHGVINGFETYAYNNEEISYRLTKTRRLTSDSANLTSVYYDNQLGSISEFDNQIIHQTKYNDLFHPNGGITVVELPKAMAGFTKKQLYSIIAEVGLDLLESDKENNVAFLTSTVANEENIYQAYSSRSKKYKRVTISTIHKIQGLTCDYTLFYMPLESSHMDLDDNLFNVATSRAKKGTLIITFDYIDLLAGKSKEIQTFLNGCRNVTDIFLTYLKTI
ncbi:AAA domain-containing protein [Candidatus Venteria ishoeyi]|uniref:AAA domain-containing protein n=1 Tax=Candidatus Venteria ishoeyi TaxID=1899563 RepID=UPI0015B33965|nr:AAA domain-containing protein [Candidatus Venteria ishoeyi]